MKLNRKIAGLENVSRLKSGRVAREQQRKRFGQWHQSSKQEQHEVKVRYLELDGTKALEWWKRN